MSALSELIQYCNIDKPVGALLLTGEWGCGKTYLVENELREKLQNTHSIVRVSLFGIPSIEELHKAVKREYIHEKGGVVDQVFKTGKFKEIVNKAKDLIPSDLAKGAVGTVLSVNLVDFIKIEKTIQNKKVIIAFDDLERSKLTTEEKLGAINEYCENQQFNVIIVADEGKMNDKSYAEFKEKVVQRTVHHIPIYGDIVTRVVDELSASEYKTFLMDKEKEITALFAGTDVDGQSLDFQSIEKIECISPIRDQNREKEKERKLDLIKHRPHNIRTLKSAIQDFERVYDILRTKPVSDIHKWLYSFLAFTLASKADLVRKSDRYGMLFGNDDVGVLYPGFFDSRFLPTCLSNWMLDGTYDEDALISYIDEHYKAEEALAPKVKVRNIRIDYLDENEAIQGMKDILPDAYSGVLELNEYVTFICNSKLAREYDLVVLDIEWEKVCEGICKRIEEHIRKGEKRELITPAIK